MSAPTRSCQASANKEIYFLEPTLPFMGAHLCQTFNFWALLRINSFVSNRRATTVLYNRRTAPSRKSEDSHVLRAHPPKSYSTTHVPSEGAPHADGRRDICHKRAEPGTFLPGCKCGLEISWFNATEPMCLVYRIHGAVYGSSKTNTEKCTWPSLY